jgi:hypothetical protein
VSTDFALPHNLRFPLFCRMNSYMRSPNIVSDSSVNWSSQHSQHMPSKSSHSLLFRDNGLFSFFDIVSQMTFKVLQFLSRADLSVSICHQTLPGDFTGLYHNLFHNPILKSSSSVDLE